MSYLSRLGMALTLGIVAGILNLVYLALQSRAPEFVALNKAKQPGDLIGPNDLTGVPIAGDLARLSHSFLSVENKELAFQMPAVRAYYEGDLILLRDLEEAAALNSQRSEILRFRVIAVGDRFKPGRGQTAVETGGDSSKVVIAVKTAALRAAESGGRPSDGSAAISTEQISATRRMLNVVRAQGDARDKSKELPPELRIHGVVVFPSGGYRSPSAGSGTSDGESIEKLASDEAALTISLAGVESVPAVILTGGDIGFVMRRTFPDAVDVLAMRVFYYSAIDPEQRTKEVVGDRLRIGRGLQNDLVLNSLFINEEAAILKKREGTWELIAVGTNAIQFGQESLYRGDRRVVQPDVPIKLFPYTLELDLPQQSDGPDRYFRDLDDATLKLIQRVHVTLIARMKGEIQNNWTSNEEIPTTDLKRWEDEIDRIAVEQGLTLEQHADWVDYLAGFAIRGRLLEQVSAASAKDAATVRFEALASRRKSWSRLATTNRDSEAELDNICRYLSQNFELDKKADLSSKLRSIEKEFADRWRGLAKSYPAPIKVYLSHRHLKKQLKDLVFGYGPLEDLLTMPTISEIMVVDSEHIYVEREGRLENSGGRFLSDEVTVAIIERIVSQVGRTIDKSRPLVDVRLTDGSRVNAVIPPLSYSGPCLTIRKFSTRKLLVDDLVRFGSLTRTVAEFLRAAVLSRQNILISGGTGTGKTTLLNCLSDFIPDQERIVTVEDTVELQLSKEHVVQLEAKEANIDGQGAYTIRDLVRNALRMRPDRIVVGECRGAEALDMLQAMNTGHDGSLTTIHANTAGDVVLRLEVMTQMAADLPVSSIHRQIATAINLIVQLRRMRNGRRMVVQVAEVIGIDPGTGRVEIRDLFLLDETNPDEPTLVPTGHLPSFMHELVAKQMIDENAFYR